MVLMVEERVLRAHLNLVERAVRYHQTVKLLSAKEMNVMTRWERLEEEEQEEEEERKEEKKEEEKEEEEIWEKEKEKWTTMLVTLGTRTLMKT